MFLSILRFYIDLVKVNIVNEVEKHIAGCILSFWRDPVSGVSDNR